MIHTDTSLIVAALMAVFTILFGVRNVQASEQHRGMMLAIAFESVVKLVALLTVGPFVLFVLFDGPSDLWAKLGEQPAIAEQLTREGSPLTWIVTSLLSAMAFLCLPRQFHVAVVEHGHPASLRTARWLFPLYLVLINLFVLPIAAAGLLLLGPQVNPDLYVLSLPLGHGASWLSTLVFIGGLSAATSMVIVACMALSAMIGNELLMPYVLRSRAGAQEAMGPMVVFVRRAAVVLILMAGYAYERIISGYLPLASIGLISFCAVANFAPGLVLGLYWRRAHRYGVVAGLAGGFVVWLYALLLPSLQATAGGSAAPLRAWLPPPLASLDPVEQGFVVGILVNTLLLVGVSLLVRARGADAEQADAFVLGAEPEPPARPTPADAQRLAELRELLARFVGSERALRALGSGPLSLQAAMAQAEHMLSGTLGAASARVIVGAFGRRGRLLGRSARALIDEASEAIRYNYDILRNSLDHVGMGIATFDKDGRLEISNDRFASLLPLDHALLRRPECAAHPRGRHAGRSRGGAAARPAAGRRICRHVQRRDGAGAHGPGAARQRPRAAPGGGDPGAAGGGAHGGARGEPRRGRGRQSRQDALHRCRQPRSAATAACRAAVHRGDDRPRPRQRARRQDRCEPGRRGIAARRAARYLQARRRRVQAGEAAIRAAADVRTRSRPPSRRWRRAATSTW